MQTLTILLGFGIFTILGYGYGIYRSNQIWYDRGRSAGWHNAINFVSTQIVNSGDPELMRKFEESMEDRP